MNRMERRNIVIAISICLFIYLFIILFRKEGDVETWEGPDIILGAVFDDGVDIEDNVYGIDDNEGGEDNESSSHISMCLFFRWEEEKYKSYYQEGYGSEYDNCIFIHVHRGMSYILTFMFIEV